MGIPDEGVCEESCSGENELRSKRIVEVGRKVIRRKAGSDGE